MTFSGERSSVKTLGACASTHKPLVFPPQSSASAAARFLFSSSAAFSRARTPSRPSSASRLSRSASASASFRRRASMRSSIESIDSPSRKHDEDAGAPPGRPARGIAGADPFGSARTNARLPSAEVTATASPSMSSAERTGASARALDASGAGFEPAKSSASSSSSEASSASPSGLTVPAPSPWVCVAPACASQSRSSSSAPAAGELAAGGAPVAPVAPAVFVDASAAVTFSSSIIRIMSSSSASPAPKPASSSMRSSMLKSSSKTPIASGERALAARPSPGDVRAACVQLRQTSPIVGILNFRSAIRWQSPTDRSATVSSLGATSEDGEARFV